MSVILNAPIHIHNLVGSTTHLGRTPAGNVALGVDGTVAAVVDADDADKVAQLEVGIHPHDANVVGEVVRFRYVRWKTTVPAFSGSSHC